MSVEKELLGCKKKLSIIFDLLSKEQERLDFLERSHYRDMRDRWSYAKDHPVTGSVTPQETAELLVINLCNRDRGN